ncbi:PspC domain-containing protein [Streptomyces sp. Ac-502]|uniref:PspC domain-containing protein n=1 Tax=Streptomyces sp. Ac-502 TaxID=3342801 RepID=UPI003862A6B4
MNDAAPAAETTGPAGATSASAGTPPPADAPGRQVPPTPLRRSRRHKVVAGVCGGWAGTGAWTR